MNIAFADTLYFVALFNPRDQWHERAIAASKLIAKTKLITTEEVLVELLNFFSEYGEKARRGAVTQAEGILSGANIDVARQSHEGFIAGLSLYKARPDKGYSLTDCISMYTMRERGITDILTHDDHFRQEGSKYCSSGRSPVNPLRFQSSHFSLRRYDTHGIRS